MTKYIPQPIVYVFKEINKGKYRSVRHFELTSSSDESTLLSHKINLSKNRNFALSLPELWLKIRAGNKWSRCLTGLFSTGTKNYYYGDLNKKQHLLIFKFLDDNETLIIRCYKDYYTTNIPHFISSIKEN